MWKALAIMQKNLVWAMPIAMCAGLASGYLFDMGFLKSAIIPLTFVMVYPMMINLKVESLLSLQGFKVQLIAQFINFAVIPFVAFFLGKALFPEQPLVILGLLLVSLLPTSGMTISWTGFAKGNTPNLSDADCYFVCN